jgi:hypothetical protein
MKTVSLFRATPFNGFPKPESKLELLSKLYSNYDGNHGYGGTYSLKAVDILSVSLFKFITEKPELSSVQIHLASSSGSAAKVSFYMESIGGKYLGGMSIDLTKWLGAVQLNGRDGPIGLSYPVSQFFTAAGDLAARITQERKAELRFRDAEHLLALMGLGNEEIFASFFKLPLENKMEQQEKFEQNLELRIALLLAEKSSALSEKQLAVLFGKYNGIPPRILTLCDSGFSSIGSIAVDTGKSLDAYVVSMNGSKAYFNFLELPNAIDYIIRHYPKN